MIIRLALLVACIAPALASATVYTVSNLPGQPAQFTTIQAAVDASSAGDTIYVTGSSVFYNESVILNRRLTVIGPGYASPLSPSAHINQILLDTIPSVSGGSGSKFIGLQLDQLYGYYSGVTHTNITVERCHLQYVLIASGQTEPQSWTIMHCYIVGYLQCATNGALTANISNNIFYEPASIGSAGLTSNVLISNNIFIGNGASTSFSDLNNAVISNNIFWGTTPVGTGMANCAFNNNITYQTPDNNIPYGTNVGSGNLVGVNPQFTNAPTQALSFTYNYRLLPGSPGENAGTDGTDIGIYGGPSPMPNQTGVPRIPTVTQFILENTTIGEGGSLNVQLKARKND